MIVLNCSYLQKLLFNCCLVAATLRSMSEFACFCGISLVAPSLEASIFFSQMCRLVNVLGSAFTVPDSSKSASMVPKV